MCWFLQIAFALHSGINSIWLWGTISIYRYNLLISCWGFLRLCSRGMLVCSLHVLSLPGFAVRMTLALLNLKHLPLLFSARCCVELLLLLKCSVEFAGKTIWACWYVFQKVCDYEFNLFNNDSIVQVTNFIMDEFGSFGFWEIGSSLLSCWLWTELFAVLSYCPLASADPQWSPLTPGPGSGKGLDLVFEGSLQNRVISTTQGVAPLPGPGALGSRGPPGSHEWDVLGAALAF